MKKKKKSPVSYVLGSLVNTPVPQTGNAAENGGKTPLLLAIEKQNDDVVKVR